MNFKKILDLNKRMDALKREIKVLQEEMKNLVADDFIKIKKTGDQELYQDYLFAIDDRFYCKRFLYTMFDK